MTIAALAPAYRFLLALHVIAVILWMAGMIVLPAIYAQHRTIGRALADQAGFAALERTIFKMIVNPAMYAAWGFGVLLILTPRAIAWGAWWWRIKVAAVLLLSWYHGALSAWRRQLRDGGGRHGVRFYQTATAIPVGFIVLIVALVVIQP
ncbi:MULTISPECIES: CopD family protein [unclassified Acidiphilium]|uniref:CopD family protein n=1 Tax=unclassified Acidiphilium TaxID=2617493 RepID=UPI000BC5E005|nr:MULTISPECIES: CopD family protein [unclassified Acidiphilium]OZB21718.1 MAG: hypothetical protein B7X49_17585 [Acidiphilium sp. 34-64-41]